MKKLSNGKGRRRKGEIKIIGGKGQRNKKIYLILIIIVIIFFGCQYEAWRLENDMVMGKLYGLSRLLIYKFV